MNENENKQADQLYAYRWNYSDQTAYDQEQRKKARKRGAGVYAIVMIVAFALCLAALAGAFLIPSKDMPNEAMTVAEVSEAVNPATVLIYAATATNSGFGTGFFVRENGYIVTNYHIVQNAETVKVTLYSGVELEAETVWYHATDDLAIIKVDGRGYPTLKIGNSDSVQVGDIAIAIGNPAGNLCPWTTTQGIISAVNRTVTVEGARSIVDLVMLQTDAQVNPGNSGGPLCNARGEVIGIVARKMTDYEGLGLAIPINGAMEYINAYLNTGSTAGIVSSLSKERPTIGIQAASVKKGDFITEEFQAPQDCVLVVDVTVGGSADGILESGDLIISANGKNIGHMDDLKGILYTCKMGDTLQLQVNRFGRILNLTIRFGVTNENF